LFPNDSFANPIWNALHSNHEHLALSSGLSCKYPADIAPMAALAENTPTALRDLHSLLEPQETTYVLGDVPPSIEGLRYGGAVPCLQMFFARDATLPTLGNLGESKIVPLTCADALAMVSLTDIAFPGFFRSRTCVMGNYYGIWNYTRDGDHLIAMAGERLLLDPWREISGVCTHPGHRGRGYAASLITQLLHDHRNRNAISCLHVVTTNQPAIDVYLRLGFQILREVHLHRVRRIEG
jgi:GNAT superfamily N-acetyltransferase